MITDELEDLHGRRYGPVGQCIYCGSRDDLTDEHIVPKGLNGTAVLLKASCESCRVVTSAVERDVLRGPRDPTTGTTEVVREMWHVRGHSGLGSGRDQPETGEILAVRDGVEETVELPVEEYPTLLHLPVLPLPGYLTGREDEQGLSVGRKVTISFGPTPREVCERLGAERIEVSANLDWPSFARMIAKISFAYAVAVKGLDAFDEIFVAEDILGHRDTIGQWVGGFPDRSLEPDRELLHKLLVHEDEERKLLLGEVRLLANSSTPTYMVVLGSLG